MIFCSLYSGSSGNCIFVSTENAKILIDAGLSGKAIQSGLSKINESISDIDGIFITHEHSDHIKGAGIVSRKYDIPIYANKITWESMLPMLGKLSEHNIRVMDNECMELNDLYIKSFEIPHDAACPRGYSVTDGKKKVCVATDMGYFTDKVKEEISDADIVLLESNHDVEMLKSGPYPYVLKRRILGNKGHMSNDDCGKAIVDITGDKLKRIMLGHLSKINNYPDLAYMTVVNILKENSIKLNKDIILSIAKRDVPSGYIEF